MYTINCKGQLIDFSVPRIMGILNLTPDSFFDGGLHTSLDEVIAHVDKMAREGAAFIDVGAVSSRPGAEMMSREEELNRLQPIVKVLVKQFPEVLFSIDTVNSYIAEKMVGDYGFAMINDISGGTLDSGMYDMVAKLKVPYVVMHMRGTPQNMQKNTVYENLIGEMLFYFSEKVDSLRQKGVCDIIIDPGFGFSKTIEQNYELLSALSKIKMLNLPIMVGLSRKSMIYKLLSFSSSEALNGTTVLNTVALMKGANILRVHDVKEAVEAVEIMKNILDK